MIDLLWSDPNWNNDYNDKDDFVISNRGAGFLWNERASDKFLHLNNLEKIVRAH
jgi:serine/threonine-protein phosphatase 2A catalytic subunit